MRCRCWLVQRKRWPSAKSCASAKSPIAAFHAMVMQQTPANPTSSPPKNVQMPRAIPPRAKIPMLKPPTDNTPMESPPRLNGAIAIPPSRTARRPQSCPRQSTPSAAFSKPQTGRLCECERAAGRTNLILLRYSQAGFGKMPACSCARILERCPRLFRAAPIQEQKQSVEKLKPIRWQTGRTNKNGHFDSGTQPQNNRGKRDK